MNLFKKEKKIKKGLISMEWVVLAYIVITLVLAFILREDMPNMSRVVSLRIEGASIILALWLAYRCIPCRFTYLARYCAQLWMLSLWYPDLFEFNCCMPYLDHFIATWDQSLFGCQPALLFAEKVSSPVFSELMCMGYVSYFFIMASVLLFYFFQRYEELEKMTFIFFTSFFLTYIVFIFVPVCGPQYYYEIVGVDNIAQGTFPDIGRYFLDNTQTQYNPGWKDGFFYKLLVFTHETGERPIAAFPSSHVAITLIMTIFAFKGNWKFGGVILFLFILICFATVYIRAHYAVDVIAGCVFGLFVYLMSWLLWLLLFEMKK
ncbi:MAG: phosphatase PAP2 family protein [Bacteroidaceae bacterium]|nr:phosphatase PAP2 family protein [Bacteroidaceae bacterium]